MIGLFARHLSSRKTSLELRVQRTRELAVNRIGLVSSFSSDDGDTTTRSSRPANARRWATESTHSS